MITSTLEWWNSSQATMVLKIVAGTAIFVAAVLAFAMRCDLGIPCAPIISLSARSDHVTHFSHTGGQTEVTLGKAQPVEAGDAIDVDARGEALLHFPDFQDVRMFRDAQLNIVATSALRPGAPAIYRLQLEAGTLFLSAGEQSAASQRLVISTKWAEIQQRPAHPANLGCGGDRSGGGTRSERRRAG